MRSLLELILERAGYERRTRLRPMPDQIVECGRCPRSLSARLIHLHRFLAHDVEFPPGMNLPADESVRRRYIDMLVRELRSLGFHIALEGVTQDEEAGI